MIVSACNKTRAGGLGVDTGAGGGDGVVKGPNGRGAGRGGMGGITGCKWTPFVTAAMAAKERERESERERERNEHFFLSDLI